MPLSDSILGRLQNQHEIIYSWMLSYSEDQLKERVVPGKWSAFENIVHLAAYHPLFIQRIGVILNNQKPQFAPYKAENDPLFYVYLEKSLQELAKDIKENRLIIVRILEAAGDEQLQYWGEHAKYGRLSLADWVEFFLLHEAHHLFTGFMLTHQLGNGRPS